MIRELENETIDEVIEAKKQGHSFIKLYLDPSLYGRGQHEIHISGAIVLKASIRGTGIGGMASYVFTPIPGQSLKFVFSRDEREFVCYLYDDKGPGYFSQIGYNRDLLATHLHEKYFTIVDPEIKKDIEARLAYRLKNPKTKRRPSNEIIDFSKESEEDLDNQIKFLLDKKKLLLGNKPNDEESKVNLTYENETTSVEESNLITDKNEENEKPENDSKTEEIKEPKVKENKIDSDKKISAPKKDENGFRMVGGVRISEAQYKKMKRTEAQRKYREKLKQKDKEKTEIVNA